MSEAESRRIFRRRFRELLESRKVTQKEIAEICGVSTSTVSTWSKGLNLPRMEKVERLAAHFGLPRSYFLEEQELGLDDFTYAMQNEARELSETDRQILLSLAKQLNEARKRKDGNDTGP